MSKFIDLTSAIPLLPRSDLLNVGAATTGAPRETEGDVIQGTSWETQAPVTDCMGDVDVIERMGMTSYYLEYASITNKKCKFFIGPAKSMWILCHGAVGYSQEW